jgi:hypothetical protein
MPSPAWRSGPTASASCSAAQQVPRRSARPGARFRPLSRNSLVALGSAGALVVAQFVLLMAAGAPSVSAAAGGVPAVASLNPNTGSTAGRTAVTISGSGFTGATSVTFGGAPASFSVASVTRIMATAPAGSTGSADVVVTTPGGSSGTSPSDRFIYGAYDHVFTIVMENRGSSSIVGDTADAPYLNSLANSYGVAANYFGVTHPSLPNYLALSAGTTFGVGSDCPPTVGGCPQGGPNLAVDRLDPAGLSWKAYMETMPSPCDAQDTNPDTNEDTASYLVHHDPFAYYTDLTSNSAECDAKVVPYPELAQDLSSPATTPNYVWITPNSCDDMHDTCTDNPIAQGDSWLAGNVPAILQSPAFKTQRSVLFITFDEDEDTGGNNQVLTIAIPSNGSGHVVSNMKYDHYSLLRRWKPSGGLLRWPAAMGRRAQ